jgi:hypothetical protein
VPNFQTRAQIIFHIMVRPFLLKSAAPFFILLFNVHCYLFSVSDTDIKQTARRNVWEEMWGSIRQATFCSIYVHCPYDMWVLVTTAWRVLGLRMGEPSPIWRVAANKLNKQSRTADKWWSSSLGVGRSANKATSLKPMLKYTHKAICFLWRQNKQEVNYSPIRISGERGVFLEKVSRSRQLKSDFF